MERILMSACLVGGKVRYNATDARDAWENLGALERWQAEGRIVSFCPELAGGFPVPRPPAEIVGGEGADVVVGRAQVLEVGGTDVTEYFLRGAHQALKEVQRLGIRIAVLKEESPSCGIHRLYRGDFSGNVKSGRGVTAHLLAQNGVYVFSEEEPDAVEACLKALEETPSSNPVPHAS